MATVKVQHEGNEIEVTLPEGYASPDELKEKYVSRDVVSSTYVLKEEFDRRFKNWIPRDKAAEDESIISQVIAKHKPKGDVDLEAAKGDWRKSELEPVHSELQSLRGQLRSAAIREAAKKHFKDDFLDNPFASVETKYGDRFEYDAKLGYVVEKRGDSFVSSLNPSEKRPYADPDEFFARLAKDPAYAKYVREPDRITGGDSYRGGTGGGGQQPNLKRKNMTPAQKAEYIGKHGQEAFFKLPNE